MEKFSDFKFEEPNIDKINADLEAILKDFESSKNASHALKVIKKYFAYTDILQSSSTIVQIRHTIDTNDEYYTKLSDLYDEYDPLISLAMDKTNKAILHSKFKDILVKKLGSFFFQKLEQADKTFKPEIVSDLQEENKYVSEYIKLYSSAKIEFRGKTYTVAQMQPFMTDKDRDSRKEAHKATWSFFESHDEEFGNIYDQLVKIRTKIALQLGYESFTQLGYDRLGRLDYTYLDVREYRRQVLKDLVPLSNKLFKKQIDSLNITEPHYYDYSLQFVSGNPKPIGDKEALIKGAQKMYKEMSPVASKYFDYMVKYELLDLDAKTGKAPGGYMTYIPSYNCSFIFSNFNGTDGDVNVLTHEFGHALQGFLGSKIEIPDYRSPGMELCEVHSMSMELFAYPWMDLLFGQDADKYRYSNLTAAIKFIPYGVSVDEFQHFVYANPQLSHADRCAAWRKIEKKYLPHREYGEDNPYLESGHFWIRQMHIFENPFYYIDYTIAQVLAFENFAKMQINQKQAFKDYIHFDKDGGQYHFEELLTRAGLVSPFKDGTIKALIPTLEKYLSTFDLSKF